MKKITAVLTAFVSALIFTLNCCGEPADITAQSAILINADTGEILYEKNAHEQRAMASTTKIMTALLTIEAGQPDKRFIADSMAIRVEGTSMGLKEGDIVTRRALCYGMLLPSGNDAANAAAVNVAGSISAFADMMNKKAAEIGMKNTHFVTPSGLDADGHYSTAYDMAILTAYAMKNEDFRKICGLTSASLEYGNPPYKRTLYNSNKLLKQYEGCIGVKTGFTDNARRCLVSAAERDGITLIAVTLNAPDDWKDHSAMLDYGFSVTEAAHITPESFTLPVLGGDRETVDAVPEYTDSIGVSEGGSENIHIKYHLPDFLYADIDKGEQVGTAKIYYKNREISSIPLVAAQDCRRLAPEKSVFGHFLEFFGLS
ncbi:MAG: D-alanyl-D-alanine carboxypeptidase [Ruminiclostridium sp.]|nr:D-alanyl-D-alanine carboxypeptidase [Ruminiclostridium sp.]